MTNAIYEALANNAIAEAERLLSLGIRTEDVVMIMTWDVYSESVVRELTLRTEITAEPETVRARFYGYNIGVVNEDAVTMFKAAVKGMNYYAGMAVGDTIIVNEDVNACRLYALENTTPVCFTDTGLTVRFEIGPPVRSVDRTEDYGRIALTDTLSLQDMMEYLPSNHEFDRYEHQLNRMASVAAAAPLVGVDWDLVFRAVQEPFWSEGNLRPKPKTRRPKEAELSAGDTKELDDFLSSFAKKGTLESAT